MLSQTQVSFSNKVLQADCWKDLFNHLDLLQHSEKCASSSCLKNTFPDRYPQTVSQGLWWPRSCEEGQPGHHTPETLEVLGRMHQHISTQQMFVRAQQTLHTKRKEAPRIHWLGSVRPWNTKPFQDVSIKSLPSGLRRGGRKSARATLTHWGTHRDCGCMHKACMVCTRWGPRAERRSGRTSSSLTQKLLPLGYHLQVKS